MTDNTEDDEPEKANKRLRIRSLKTSQDCVAENSLTYSKFMRGEMSRSDALAASSIITASRNMIESTKTEEKLAELEGHVERLAATMGAGNTVVQFKRQA